MHATFKAAREGLKATGASTLDEELVTLLEQHGADEGAILDAYERVANGSACPIAEYLVGLIVDDERRHHHMLEQVATSIAWGGLTPGHDLDRVPTGTGLGSEKLLEQTRRLFELERRDQRQLASLRRRLSDFDRTTPWLLLVETMILDTRKHELMLKFLLGRVAAPANR